MDNLMGKAVMQLGVGAQGTQFVDVLASVALDFNATGDEIAKGYHAAAA